MHSNSNIQSGGEDLGLDRCDVCDTYVVSEDAIFCSTCSGLFDTEDCYDEHLEDCEGVE